MPLAFMLLEPPVTFTRMPGAVMASVVRSPPAMGRLTTCVLLKLVSRLAFSVCRTAASAVTSTVVVVPCAFMVMLTSCAWPTSSVILEMFDFSPFEPAEIA